MEEHVAYSSPDWDGRMEDGHIVDEGTRGWCITRLGESIIHANEPVDVWTIQRTPSKVQVRFVDVVQSGIINLN